MSALASRSKPRRRKAARPARRRLAKALNFRLTVEAQEMLVRFTPDNSGSAFAMGHFEFRSPRNPPRRIPVSETGYWSHFVPMEDIEVSPQDYARELVLAVVSRGPKHPAHAEDEQLRLF